MSSLSPKVELLIAKDGTLYHLDLKRADGIPFNLILVGAADRVDEIARYFEKVSFVHTNPARPEFHIACGVYQGVNLGVLSVGIGTPSMEIVCNELHALFEYNHGKNQWQNPARPVNIIRLGTCGTSLPDIPLGALAISQYSLGLDNAGLFYPPLKEDKAAKLLGAAFRKTALGKLHPELYVAPAASPVVEILQRVAAELKIDQIYTGLTTSSPGFFAAEGRKVGRLRPVFSLQQFIEQMNAFSYQGLKIINHEMETSILFRLLHEQLGYNVGSLCLVLDNVRNNEVIKKALYRKRLDAAIRIVLNSLVRLFSANKV